MRVFDNSDPQHVAIKDFIFDWTVKVDGVVFTIPSRAAS
jgi:hypothetical protein